MDTTFSPATRDGYARLAEALAWPSALEMAALPSGSPQVLSCVPDRVAPPSSSRPRRPVGWQQAIDAILGKYFRVVYYASLADVRSLFGLHPEEARQALARLAAAGCITGPVRLSRRPGLFWIRGEFTTDARG